MKNYLLLGICVFLAACAGNPPEWWNPTGSYADSSKQKKEATQTAAKSSTVSKQSQDDLMLVEENIDTAEDDYEELDLSDKPAATTEQAAKTDTPAKATSSLPAGPIEEHLPADGSLPPPSVLE